jgi:hypothetical protein
VFRSVLIPLEQLNRETRKIRNGNLEVEGWGEPVIEKSFDPDIYGSLTRGTQTEESCCGVLSNMFIQKNKTADQIRQNIIVVIRAKMCYTIDMQ